MMHIVVKGSWVRSSLENAIHWVTRGQAMVPLPSLRHTHTQAIKSNCRKPVQIKNLPLLKAFAIVPCTHL